MNDQFELHGEPKTDSALYPWALGSIARALLFYAEAISSKNNRAVAAICTYYSLFHFSMFMLFCCPHLLTIDQRRRINEALDQGQRDPSHIISHTMILNFLNTCVTNGLSDSVRSAVIQSKQFREFINYGPRVKDSPGEVFVNTCELQPSAVDRVLDNLEHVFEEAVLWTCSNSFDDGIWIPIALDQASAFFSGPQRFYLDWCSESVAEKSEMLRQSLHLIANQRVYAKTK